MQRSEPLIAAGVVREHDVPGFPVRAQSAVAVRTWRSICSRMIAYWAAIQRCLCAIWASTISMRRRTSSVRWRG